MRATCPAFFYWWSQNRSRKAQILRHYVISASPWVISSFLGPYFPHNIVFRPPSCRRYAVLSTTWITRHLPLVGGFLEKPCFCKTYRDKIITLPCGLLMLEEVESYWMPVPRYQTTRCQIPGGNIHLITYFRCRTNLCLYNYILYYIYFIFIFKLRCFVSLPNCP